MFLLHSGVCACHAQTLLRPKLPAGYTWQEVPEMGCAFLKPTGWHYKHIEQKGQHACFITKEDIVPRAHSKPA